VLFPASNTPALGCNNALESMCRSGGGRKFEAGRASRAPPHLLYHCNLPEPHHGPEQPSYSARHLASRLHLPFRSCKLCGNHISKHP
jgi:hypothetical protein